MSGPTRWRHENRCLSYDGLAGVRCGSQRLPDSKYCRRHAQQRGLARAAAENQAEYARRLIEEAARRRESQGVGILIPPPREVAAPVQVAPQPREPGPGDPEWEEMHHMYFGDVDDDGPETDPLDL